MSGFLETEVVVKGVGRASWLGCPLWVQYSVIVKSPVTLHNALGDQLHDVFLCEEAAVLSKDDVITGTFSAPSSFPRGASSYR